MDFLKKICFDGFLVSLADILSCIASTTCNYRWTLYEFDGYLSTTSEFDVNTISESALKNDLGYTIDTTRLLQLAHDIEQTHDLVLAGQAPNEITLKFENDDMWRASNKIVIEMVDCGKWEISSIIPQIIVDLQKLTKA